jgi:hypothetical protein
VLVCLTFKLILRVIGCVVPYIYILISRVPGSSLYISFRPGSTISI